MPSIFNVPPPYVNGFKELFFLSDKDYDSIIDGLSVTSLAASIKKLAAIVTASDPSRNELVREIFLSAGSLTPIIEKGISIDEISEDIYNAVFGNHESNEEPQIGLSVNNGRDIFVKRLSTLLNTQRLYYAAKANSLMFEYQNVFIEAKAITDIRPVYNLNTDESPKGGVIIHNLHIHYQCDKETEHRDIYLAMDSEDIKILKEILTRAEKKENSLKRIFELSGMINLNE